MVSWRNWFHQLWRAFSKKKKKKKASSAIEFWEIDFPRSTRRIFPGKETVAVISKKWGGSRCQLNYQREKTTSAVARQVWLKIGASAWADGKGCKYLHFCDCFEVVCFFSWYPTAQTQPEVQSIPDRVLFNLNLSLFDDNCLMLQLMSPEV